MRPHVEKEDSYFPEGRRAVEARVEKEDCPCVEKEDSYFPEGRRAVEARVEKEDS